MCKMCELEDYIEVIELLNPEFERRACLTNNNGIHTIDIAINSPFDDLAVIKINYCPMCGRKLGD